MPDFTLKTYTALIRSLPRERTMTVSGFFAEPRGCVLLLRHDVDAGPSHSLRFAEIQSELAVRGTYYFRIVPGSYQPFIMERIARLGHEIGYHYEDVAAALKVLKKKRRTLNEDTLIETAYEGFLLNLAEFRKHFDVRTICGHGSPLCRYDNGMMWKKYNYQALGILGDAGRDVDFAEFQYLTDTGRCWNGARVSLRDKHSPGARRTYRDSFEIMDAVRDGGFPGKVMMTFHPQRWNDNPARWALELVGQKSKNVVKYFLVRRMQNTEPTETG
jgi:hypothetical protein